VTVIAKSYFKELFMPIYRYGLVKPQRAQGAPEHNAAWLGPDTLGIEVTEPELAARCGLGNIDPQHCGGNSDISAIDAAFDWPLPAIGARLVTIRPDADAFGAMAVLTLRADGISFSDEAQKRIALVNRSDCFDRGCWPGLRPLPTCVEDIDEVGIGVENLGAIIAGLSLPETTIEEGVRQMMLWLLTGAAPRIWIALARKSAARLFAALGDGTVVVREIIPGSVALVDGFVPGALRLGYRRAPIVVATNTQKLSDHAPLRRITIAQYTPGYVDLVRVARALAAGEPGWGGSTTIIGSPQGVNCKTSVDNCIKVLRNWCE
jgi:hypothetical protein